MPHKRTGPRREQHRARRGGGPPAPPPAPLPPLRLGAVPGATPGKWIQRWREQRPQQRLDLVLLDAASQLDQLRADNVDVAICRGPVAGDDLHVVALYDDATVVVMAAESHLTAVDELTAEDLEGEVLITPRDDVLGELALPTIRPDFGPVATTEDAVATAASGVGIVVVPMSLARLHHRKDATYRPLRDHPASPVQLVWLRDRDADDVQTFVGITRGRSARSSR